MYDQNEGKDKKLKILNQTRQAHRQSLPVSSFHSFCLLGFFLFLLSFFFLFLLHQLRVETANLVPLLERS
jgi:hypothetical protein